MILFFTDFGYEGPYVGQMHAVAAEIAPTVPRLDLMHDAPRFDPRAAAYLLAALVPYMPQRCTVCAVVDPGVGSDRETVVLDADGRFFVGPHNGLLEIVARRSETASRHRLKDIPVSISASFHGRDLFAPAAARLAAGRLPSMENLEGDRPGEDWPEELDEVVYIDAFGNAMTGRRARSVCDGTAPSVNNQPLAQARTFSNVPPGTPFWYVNSLGLVEIAINQGNAARELGLAVGSAIDW